MCFVVLAFGEAVVLENGKLTSKAARVSSRDVLGVRGRPKLAPRVVLSPLDGLRPFGTARVRAGLFPFGQLHLRW